MCFKHPVKWMESEPLIPHLNDPVTKGIYIVAAAMLHQLHI